MFMPFQILGMWFRGLLAIAILAGGVYLLKGWYDDSHVTLVEIPADGPPTDDQKIDRTRDALRNGEGRRIFRYEPGWNQGTAMLLGGVALMAWATLGRSIGQGWYRLTLRSGSASNPSPRSSPAASSELKRESKKIRRQKSRKMRELAATRPAVTLEPEADDDPRAERVGEVHTIPRPDGSVLRVECYGPVDAPPIVFTHGWGANSTEWFYQKRHLAERFRLIVWDEPGLGLSKKPDTNDYRLENLAADLDAVLEFAGPRPAVLVGHSIGGMITLTFCKLFPEALGTRVAGLVLAHTSYTNPVRTTQMAGLYTAIEKPVLIPLMYLVIALWPLAWLMNWMSYLNGSTHKSTHTGSFSGDETKGQLDFVADYMPRDRPDVLARGMLGMIAYDATETLPRIGVPTLVVVGDLDSTTKPEAGQYIASHVRKGRLATLSPARHMGLLEHHERFDHLVAEFVASCQSTVMVG